VLYYVAFGGLLVAGVAAYYFNSQRGKA